MARLLLHGAFIHAFVHRCDMSGWELSELASLITGEVRDPGEAAEHAVLTRVVWALLADGDQAARVLASDHGGGAMSTDPVVHATADLAELVLAQKAGQPSRCLFGRDLAAGSLLSGGEAAATRLPCGRGAGLRDGPFLGWSSARVRRSARTHRGGTPASGRGRLAGGGPGNGGSRRVVLDAIPSGVGREQARPKSCSRPNTLRLPSPFSLAAALRCLIGADHAGLDRVLKGTLFRDVVERNLVWSRPLSWSRLPC